MTAPDSRFERGGSDLFYNQTITLADALVGFSKQARRPPASRLLLLVLTRGGAGYGALCGEAPGACSSISAEGRRGGAGAAGGAPGRAPGSSGGAGRHPPRAGGAAQGRRHAPARLGAQLSALIPHPAHARELFMPMRVGPCAAVSRLVVSPLSFLTRTSCGIFSGCTNSA